MTDRPSLAVAVRPTTRGGVVVDLVGDIDERAEASLQGAFGAAAGDLTLNFGGVEYVNSTGLGILLQALAGARREGRQVRACCVSEHFREILIITRIDELMQVVDDEGDL